MIGAAPGDRGDELRLARPQIRRHFRGRRCVGGQLAADDRAGLGYFRGHERLAHRVAPSDRRRKMWPGGLADLTQLESGIKEPLFPE